MSKLRRLSTLKLLAICAVAVLGLAAGVAIAAAVTSSRHPPPPRSLPTAVQRALGAPEPSGISARIKYTNKLLGSSLLGEHASPLLAGGSGRLWFARGGRLRVELQADRGDTQLVADGHSIMLSDPSSNTVYRAVLPAPRAHSGGRGRHERAPSLNQIREALARLSRVAAVLGPGREVLAARPAYSVRIEPRHNSGLLKGAELAWDAVRGVPLRVAIYARGVPSPVLELEVTDISYGRVPASTFDVPAPAGAPVQTLHLRRDARREPERLAERHRITRLPAIRRALGFPLSAPARLVGLHRTGVRLLAAGKSPAAAISYGRPLLGGLLVIEQPATDRSGIRLRLPRLTIGGTKVRELATALGTLIEFERGGVRYTIAGLVTRARAEAAARGL